MSTWIPCLTPDGFAAVDDGHNDIELISRVGHGVAMRQVAPEFEQVAESVTEHIAHGADPVVYRWFIAEPS